MNKENASGLKAPAYAALALAFASFGDAFLYPFLPVNSQAVAVPIAWVGILLSVNRFVRIFSNTMMVHIISKQGLRFTMIIAVMLAIFSTLGYAISTSVVLWLFFRVCWGLSFSAMRIGTLGYALTQSNQGTALGTSKSLQEAGPMAALLLAPLLLQKFPVNQIFFLLALLSAPSIYFAWRLPRTEHIQVPVPNTTFLRWPSTFNAITLLTAVLIDGIIVVVLGVLFLKYRDNISLIMATSLAAFYLGYRRICLVALSPAGGWLADKIGLDTIFKVSMVFIIAGLIFLISGWITVGSVIVFTFYSINSAITPASAAKNQSHSLSAVAENATWRDVGAAAGTVIGGLLISSPYLINIMLIATLLLTFLFLIYWGAASRALKLLYLWK